MWNSVMEAAQSPALHWGVVAVAVLAYVYYTLRSGDGPLMGDMYDDLDV
jgi:hypothetical protein